VKNPSSRRFLIELETYRSWQGKQLPSDLKARIIREHARLRTVEEQIYGLKKEQEQRLEQKSSSIDGASWHRGDEFLEVCDGVFWLARV
jgi:hypothetical protein